MSPPNPQSMARISEVTGIHVATLYLWRKGWRLEGEVVPASQKDPEGWGAADKFTVVLETAAFNATELSAYCRERGLYPEQVSHWRQVAQNANAKPVRTMAEQKDLEKLHAQDQREIKALKKELQRKEKALAEAAALLVLRKSGRTSARRTRKADECRPAADGDRADRRGECRWRQTGERLLSTRTFPAYPQTLATCLYG
jgi:hypothetical protein